MRLKETCLKSRDVVGLLGDDFNSQVRLARASLAEQGSCANFGMAYVDTFLRALSSLENPVHIRPHDFEFPKDLP